MSQIPPYSSQPAFVAPHRGVLILVFGVLSLIVCGPLGIPAWIMGQSDLNRMKVGTMDPEGRGLTMAGMICGIISSVLLVLGFVIGILWLIIVFAVLGGAAAAGP